MAGKNGYVTVDTEGKRYRVRDKNFGKGKAYIVWAEDLPYEEAHVLKERLCGLEKTRTARIEEMTVPLEGVPVTAKGDPFEVAAPAPAPRASALVTKATDPDPQIAAVQARALAAARGATQQAQQRAAVQIPPVETPANGESEIIVPDNIEDELEGLVDGGDADLPA